ncbi:MAG: Gfo/Idh/MocA family oxidoreductase [Candidatus Latescibacteria bacterium]|nr:Gfo/Idh/MocA family oxidoreductase [Candidatus Latescibacterota bacterium]
MNASALRVAIAGASGIGRHHGKWHHQAGASVVGFLGRDEQSCAATAAGLRATFPFTGRAYWDLGRLLAVEQPQVVDICVPNELHFSCARQALEAGCHILCEKPLVWQAGSGFAQLLDQARLLVALARKHHLQLGICTQYAASLPHYRCLYEAVRGPLGEISSFFAEMESVSRGRQRDARTMWIDMGPHPLSLLLSWFPDGAIDPASLRVEFAGSQARAEFDFVADGRCCQSQILIRDRQEGSPVRRFGVNGLVVDCLGRTDAAGVYRAVLRQGETEVVGDDFMQLLIAQFDQAAGQGSPPLVDGATGVRNLELQLEILQEAERR